jgi:acyl-homoserine-lactone acylase
MTLDTLQESLYSNHMELADRVLDDLIGAATGATGTISPLAKEAAAVLTAWDRRADADSRGAVLFTLWGMEVARGSPDFATVFMEVWDPHAPLTTPTGLVNPEAAVVALETVARQILADYGALDIPWGAVMRLRRAEVDLPAHGAYGDPLGVIHVVAFTPAADGRFASSFGDTFIAAVEFGVVVRARVMTSYGNATQPGSRHNGDQLPSFRPKAA